MFFLHIAFDVHILHKIPYQPYSRKVQFFMELFCTIVPIVLSLLMAEIYKNSSFLAGFNRLNTILQVSKYKPKTSAM